MKRHKKFLAIALTPLLLLILIVVGVAGFFSNVEQFCQTQNLGTYYLPTAGGPVPRVQGFDLPEQLENIATIRDVGVARHRSLRDIKIALMVAKQESNLKNLAYGDRDSLGLFQQRPSQGWGTAAQIMDPIYSSNKFYEALERVANRDSMPLIEVGIEVQKPSRQAYGATFNLWDSPVSVIVDGFVSDATDAVGVMPSDSDCLQFTGGDNSLVVELAVQAALSQYGKPYAWPVTDPFDNSGFIQWSYRKAGVSLPLGASAQYQFGTAIPRPGGGTPNEWLAVLHRGDLLYWSSPGLLGLQPRMSYVTMYLGNSQMVDVSGQNHSPVVVSVKWTNSPRQFLGATRPITVAAPDGSLSDGWRWPLDSIHITSPFGMRVHPITGVRKLHDGVDFAASMATPVKAAHSGRVISASPAGGYGNYVVIDHGGIVTGYAHLSAIVVTVGQQVSVGQVIGLLGSTGFSTGPHLHFNVKVNGEYVDPITFMRQFGLVP